ncbi:MAG: hypothetical protein LN415_07530 [Candidatus Thermoplasmatota archaeon]|nr:hypothetical protein [Candidatus Thermoplasmatota archaeon]
MSKRIRRAALRAQRRRRTLEFVFFAVVTIVLGSSVAALHLDQAYLAGRDNLTVYVPDRLYTDISTTALVLATTPDGTPKADQEVRIELVTSEGAQLLHRGRTGPDGMDLPALFAPTGETEGRLVISSGGEVVTRTIQLTSSVRTYMSTDKPVYQPGQTVHIRTLTFEGEASAVSTREVVLSVFSPDDDRIFRKVLEPNGFGITSFDYPLGHILPLGVYRLEADVAGSVVSTAFAVQHYVLPKFQISLSGVQGWYAVRERIIGEVSAEYFFGKYVAGEVTLDLFHADEGYTSVGSATRVLLFGKAPFAIVPDWDSIPDDPKGYFELNVTAVDQAGQTERKTFRLPIAEYPILLSVVQDSNVLGARSVHHVIARFPDGSPVADALVSYAPPGGPTINTRTDERGVASLSFEFRYEGAMKVTVTKDSYSSWVYVYQSGGEGVKVVSDRPRYDAGNVAVFDVFYEGPSSTPWAYYEISSRGFIVSTGRLELHSGQGSLSLPIRQDMIPQIRVKVYKVGTDLHIFEDVLILSVGTLSDLSISVTTDKIQYAPHEPVTISFTVTDGPQPVVSALGVSIVDKAVFEVSGLPDELEEVFRGLEGSSPEEEIIDYLYNDARVVTTLAPPVVEESSESEAIMISTYAYHADRAEELKESGIAVLWSGFFMGLAAGYMGLIFVAVKYRESRSPVIATLLMVIITVTLAITLNSMVSGLVGTGTSPTVGGGSGRDSTAWDQSGWAGLGIDLDESGDSDANLDAFLIRQPTRVRHFFPETWYWNPTLVTDETGQASVSLMTPDSITSWEVGVMASTKDAKFGTTSANITVFQEFFVEPDMPLAAVVGDEFPLRVAVYNYLDEDNQVLVTLGNDSWFSILDGGNRFLDIAANSVESVHFTIRAEEFGVHPILITAGNARVSDAVLRNLTVEPKGRWVERVFSGELSGDDSDVVVFDLNPNRNPGTETAYLKFQGGFTSVVLDGAENFIVFVTGCGEQSTSRLSVDVAAYKHLLESGKSSEELAKYEETIIKGIQYELGFLRSDPFVPGRAITWYRQPPPDMWLTAWALFAFQDVKEAGFGLDDRITDDLHKYLISTMQSDGSFIFPEVGHWSINSELKGQRVAATAYVLRALLYSGYEPDSRTDKAVGYIERNVRMDDGAFTLALALTALEMADGDSPLRDELAGTLVSIAQDGGNETKYWQYSGEETGYYYYGRNYIETTSYAVIALSLHGGYYSDTMAGVHYMLTHRDTGRWGSTHDTAVAFQALSLAGGFSVISNVDIQARVNSTLVAETIFTQDDEDRLFLVDITANLSATTRVDLASYGSGTIFYQLIVRENIPEPSIDPLLPPIELEVILDKTQATVGETITGSVKVTYTGERGMTKMILVELKAPAGMCLKTSEFEGLLQLGVIGMHETSCQRALIYLENVERNTPKEFQFTLDATQPVTVTLQGINAFDMYDPTAIVYSPPVEIIIGS